LIDFNPLTVITDSVVTGKSTTPRAPNGTTIFAARFAPSVICHLIDAIPKGVSIDADAKEKPSPGRGANVM
jgi:hypothetical protein